MGFTPCFMDDDVLGSSAPPFLGTSRARSGTGWNTSSLWLTRHELTGDTLVNVN